MNVRMLIELATAGIQDHKQTYFGTEFFGLFEQGPVVGKGRLEFIGHGEGNVLSFAVGDNMPLLSNPFSAISPYGTSTFIRSRKRDLREE